MTIKLNSLARWRAYKGDAVVLKGREEGERRIRLHLNADAETAVYRTWPDVEDAQLLAVVGPGLETIEFSASGDVGFICVPRVADAQVWYQTADDEPTFARVVDPVIFTRIANRRHRNPELEEVMYRMQLNMERRLAQQAGEIEAALERRRTEEANGRPAETVVTNAPGAPAPSGGEAVQPQEPAAPVEPGEASGGAPDGEQPGG